MAGKIVIGHRFNKDKRMEGWEWLIGYPKNMQKLFFVSLNLPLQLMCKHLIHDK
jgi:hypothetical protein